MKNFQSLTLPILFFAAGLQAQDTASVTFIPSTGDYLLQYTVNGIQYSDTLEPPTKIHPTVSCVTSFDNSVRLYGYLYTIGLLPMSQQLLMSFSVEHKAVIVSPQKPNATWRMFAWYPQVWKWSNSLINPSGLRPDTTDIGPGESMAGFSFRSPGLPSIVKGYFSGNAVSLAFTGEPPSLMEELLVPLRVFPNDQVIRSTIGPMTPPTPFNVLTFLDTLASYTTRSRSLGWIEDQTTADKYLSYFSSARAKLVQQDSVGARTPLQQVLRDVDIDSTANLTSEAYALLRYNTEYLLNQLPVGQEGIAPYSLFAIHSMWLKENSKVYSGSIGVDSAGSPPFLDSQVELSVGQRVTIASGSLVKAHRIKIKQGATVNGDVYYNELENNGTITGSQQTPLSLPLVASLPEFKVSTPGAQNISVAQNGSQTLLPGSYGDIDIKKNGRLLLTGGTYHLKSITAGEDTRVVVQSTSELRIAEKFSSGEGSYVGPEDTTRLRADDIKFYVGGINGKSGTLGADPKAAKVGMRNTVKATFYVPNGTLWIREGSEVEGVFLGKDVEVGIGVKVWWKSGF
jgi:hypothetical protein